jgi:hypothetical protein
VSNQFRFLNTLPPGAGAADAVALLAVGSFFCIPIPLIVLMTVFFTGAFFTGTIFLTTVEVLESLLSLVVLALPLPTLGADAGGAALLPLPTPVVGFSAVTLRETAPRVDFAFSTMLLRIPDAPPVGAEAAGFRGDPMGRARNDFVGEAGRIGDLGRVREFADLGESTCEGSNFALEAVRVGGIGGPRARFLGLSISSFSLSISSL